MFQRLTDILARRSKPLKVFFRDDDGGWSNDQMDQLCEWFYQRRLPLDVAVIPKALDKESVSVLGKWLQTEGADIHLHQHGYSHGNHQSAGRGCEFGSDRNYQQQLNDIINGKSILEATFSSQIEPIFTPPWNRCTSETVMALNRAGIKYLSRITGSTDLGSLGAVEPIDVSIDWLKSKKGIRLSGEPLIQYIVSQFETAASTVGIMLHHQHMHTDELELLDQCIHVLKQSEKIEFGSMLTVARSKQK